MFSSILLASALGSTPASPDEPADPTLQMTRVYAGECIGEPYPVPGRFGAEIVAAIAPVLIKESLTRLGVALRKAGEAHTETRTGTANVEIRPNRLPQCVQIVVGSFHLTCTRTNEDVCSELSGTDWLGFGDTDRATAAERSMSHLGMVLADRPNLFFEGRLRWSADGKALEMEPSLLLYRKTLRSNFMRGNERDIVITLGLAEPGSAGDDKGVRGNVILEALTPSETLYRFSPGVGPSTAWMAAPVAGGSEPVPRTLLLSFAETRKASEFLTFVADVFEGSKEPLQKVAEEAINAQKRAAAEIAAATTAASAANAAVTAEAAGRDALAAFREARDSGAADVRTKAAAAFSAMTNANLAAKKAGLGAPFSDAELAEARAGAGG